MTARRSRTVVPQLLILPAVLLSAFVVVGGLGVLVAQAVGELPVVGPASFSLAPFTASGTELPESVLASLGIASVSTVLAVVVGFTAAVLVLRVSGSSRLVEWAGTLTVPVPHLIGAASVGLLLADGGLLPRLLGLGEGRWPDLVGAPGEIATVFEYAWKESAFVALVVVGALATRLAAYDETATMLGAGPVARIRYVVLPLAVPALLVAGGIVFVYSMGAYEVPWLLGRAYPEPLPVLAVRLYNGVTLTSRPAAAAVAVITLALTAAVAAVALTSLRAVRRWR